MRTLCLLLLLLLTLLCGACTAGEADRQPATDAPLPPANRETTTPETTAQEPLLPLVLPEPVPLPAAQAPASLEATVLPLTNARGIYRSCIIGETAFVDLEGQRIALLPGVTEYHAIHDQVTDSVNGYALFNAQGRYALMNNQGRVVSDFIYEPFDPADGYVFWGGYAYAITTVTDPANDGYWPFYGLVDLRSGEEILPPRYGNLSLWPHHIVAQSDGMDQILDYQGNLLFEDQNLPTMESEDNLYFSARGASNYHYLASSGELFYYSEPENTLTIYEDFYIIRDDSSYNGTGMTISVYDKDQRHLYSAEQAVFYHGEGLLVVQNKAETVALTSEGQRETFHNLPAYYSGRYVADVDYQPGSLSFLVPLEEPYGYAERISHDPTGRETAHETVREETRLDNGIRIRFAPNYTQQIEDERGKIIIPFDQYEYIWQYAPFLIGTTIDQRENQFDIRNAQGEVLLHNPLGATFREGIAGESMIVWLDETTCVLLHSDGSTTEIADPPAVELVYFGG